MTLCWSCPRCAHVLGVVSTRHGIQCPECDTLDPDRSVHLVECETLEPREVSKLPNCGRVGSRLRQLIPFREREGCGCAAHARRLDNLGVHGCAYYSAEIVDELQERAKKFKYPWSRTAAKALLCKAIRDERQSLPRLKGVAVWIRPELTTAQIKQVMRVIPYNCRVSVQAFPEGSSLIYESDEVAVTSASINSDVRKLLEHLDIQG